MAIDKSRTSKGMKVGVIILIIAFVGGIGGLGSLALLQPTAPATTGTASNAGLEQIGKNNMAAIGPNEQALQANPKDYNLLKTLGNQYFDYAQQVRTSSPGSSLDVTIWQRAADYYGRALAVTPGDPAVATDMAIAKFYSNDVTGAIATIEDTMKKSPQFAQAPFNAGIFYRSAGDTAKAKAAWETYLKLEPNGSNAADAKKFIAEVGSAPQTAPANNPPASTTTTP